MTAPRPIRAPAGTVAHRAIVDAAVPPLAAIEGRSMVSRWSDHQQRDLQDAVNDAVARSRAQCCIPAFETLGRAHAIGCPTGVPRG